MKTFIGAVSLLATAIVGVFAVQELHKATTAAGGQGAVITVAETRIKTSAQEDLQIQHQAGDFEELFTYQARFVPSVQDED